mmetsp:Transcript_24579/g.35733  ORF Transcript_24579/g.35733 Transcript_24579/m.35733 type:complete len:552 (+) Transcript_24579:121-1776(+)
MANQRQKHSRSLKAKHIFFLFIILSLLSFHTVLYLSHNFITASTPPPLHKFLRSNDDDKPHPAARGPNPLPQKLTPALIGAQRGHIHNCPIDTNKLAYWNDPMGYFDMNFHSPFASSSSGRTKYLTFEPDQGGWNNIRMSMENMIVLAAAMGRTLVLPPDQPLYLLKNDEARRQRGFTDFFNLQTKELQRHVPIITAEEFIKKEGGLDVVTKTKSNAKDQQIHVPEHFKKGVKEVMAHCEHRLKSKIWCGKLYDYYKEVGYVPSVHGGKNCFIFDKYSLENDKMIPDESVVENIKKFCGRRKAVYYDKQMQDTTLIHFRTSENVFRILNHFYSFVHFTDPAIGNFYKRLIRDHIHYHDSIFCAASKIIQSLQKEGSKHEFIPDKEGGGGFSSMHIRRGDFQWKKMRISAEEWYENTKDYWRKNEILYITTDEKNKTFFEPLARHHELRFLDNYEELAGLSDLDPNYKGMIESVVASRGRIFVGTYFSSFSAYIGRLRGYYGMSGNLMWYGQKDRRDEMQKWVDPKTSYSAREFPIGWSGIDGETVPSEDSF